MDVLVFHSVFFFFEEGKKVLEKGENGFGRCAIFFREFSIKRKEEKNGVIILEKKKVSSPTPFRSLHKFPMNFELIAIITSIIFKTFTLSTTIYSLSTPFLILEKNTRKGFNRTYELLFASTWIVLETFNFETILEEYPVEQSLFESRIFQTVLVMCIVSTLVFRMCDLYYLNTERALNRRFTFFCKGFGVILFALTVSGLLSIFLYLQDPFHTRVALQVVLVAFLFFSFFSCFILSKLLSDEKQTLFHISYQFLMMLTVHQTIMLIGMIAKPNEPSMVLDSFVFAFVFDFPRFTPLVLVFCIMTHVYIRKLNDYFSFMNQCYSLSFTLYGDDISVEQYRSVFDFFRKLQWSNPIGLEKEDFIKSATFRQFNEFLTEKKLQEQFTQESLTEVRDIIILRSYLEGLIKKFEKSSLVHPEVKFPEYANDLINFFGFSQEKKSGKQEKSLVDSCEEVVEEINNKLIEKYLNEFLIRHFPKTKRFRMSKIKYFDGSLYSESVTSSGLFLEERFMEWSLGTPWSCCDFHSDIPNNAYENINKTSNKTDDSLVELMEMSENKVSKRKKKE